MQSDLFGEGSSSEPEQAAPAFDAFWAVWPRRVAKLEAQKAWKSLNAAKQRAALAAAPLHAQAWAASRRDKGLIPHAATWLRGERWEDDIEHVSPPSRGLVAAGQRFAPGQSAGQDTEVRQRVNDDARRMLFGRGATVNG
ncbi:Uncharacterised protein [Bordetella ansorpii]|uniref:Phage protein n=1 Tax=Bordetella ansorpii TaxID=288768 RepID=A0A157RM83_9BORD|nr:hypothetical protein [Bordetella ansorpii]SAI58976.1 Uncharacterised protein [Bordetella ansorpii]